MYPPFFFFFFTSILTTISSSSSLQLSDSEEYFELIPPPRSELLTPSCIHPIIPTTTITKTTATATATANTTLSKPYTPPLDCPAPWTRVILELRAVAGRTPTTSSNPSYCIAGLWLGGCEVLRTSTPPPLPTIATAAAATNTTPRTVWKVRKDITRYSSLLQDKNLNISMTFQNVVDNFDDSFHDAGSFNITVTFLFYAGNSGTVPFNPIVLARETTRNDNGGNVVRGRRGLYETPADLIIPISSDDGDNGFWFKIKNDLDSPSKQILVPRNAYRAVIELYVSNHGDDEFWYANTPTSYLRGNNISSLRGNGNYREVFVTIDGTSVGLDLPFPVIFPGGLNPFLWKPIVGIGAFNLPTYDFDVTPFLHKVLDGQVHDFGVGVCDSIPYWLADANLHLWLDKNVSTVPAGGVRVSENPVLDLKTKQEFKGLEGEFETKGKGRSEHRGWAVSSAGNLTTVVFQTYRFESEVQLRDKGTRKIAKVVIKRRREVKVLDEMGNLIDRVLTKRTYPLSLNNATLRGKIVTNVTHAFEEKYSNGNYTRNVINNQRSNGWLPMAGQLVGGGGGGRTRQSLRYNDGSYCYSRTVEAINGVLSGDQLRHGCAI